MYIFIELLIFSTSSLVFTTGNQFVELQLVNDEHQPLVLTKSNKDFKNVQVAMLDPYYTGNLIQFGLPDDNTITLACPAETKEQMEEEQEYIKNNQDDISEGTFLFENLDSTKHSCEHNLKASYYRLQGTKCGKNNKGYPLLIGYDRPQYAEMYTVCYSDEEGVLFIDHHPHITQGLQTKSLDEILEKITPVAEPELVTHYIVPKEDAILEPRKIATETRFNKIQINENMKVYLDKLNDFIRYYLVQNYQESTTFIRTGFTKNQKVTKSSHESNWHWKLVWRKLSTGPGGLFTKYEAIAIVITEGDSCTSPCANSEKSCKITGLEPLRKIIPCFYCCKADFDFGTLFGAMMKENSKSYYDYVRSDGFFKFNEKYHRKSSDDWYHEDVYHRNTNFGSVAKASQSSNSSSGYGISTTTVLAAQDTYSGGYSNHGDSGGGGGGGGGGESGGGGGGSDD